jgi:hypothetical protein
MTRYVVNNSQVPHLWAHQSQDHAKGNGSISFSGRSIYSYAAEIGRLADAPNGERVALLISRTWSITTSGHQSAARSAVSHMPHVVTRSSALILNSATIQRLIYVTGVKPCGYTLLPHGSDGMADMPFNNFSVARRVCQTMREIAAARPDFFPPSSIAKAKAARSSLADHVLH